MTIWMIWAAESDMLTLVEAWDDDSVSGNRSGWDEKVKHWGKIYGANNIRVARTDVEYSKLEKFFYPVDI